jgi:hypothetical protein
MFGVMPITPIVPAHGVANLRNRDDYQRAAAKLSRIFSCLVINLVLAAIASPTIIRSKGSLVHDSPPAACITATIDESERDNPIRWPRSPRMVGPLTVSRPISKRCVNSSSTIGETTRSLLLIASIADLLKRSRVPAYSQTTTCVSRRTTASILPTNRDSQSPRSLQSRHRADGLSDRFGYAAHQERCEACARCVRSRLSRQFPVRDRAHGKYFPEVLKRLGPCPY